VHPAWIFIVIQSECLPGLLIWEVGFGFQVVHDLIDLVDRIDGSLTKIFAGLDCAGVVHVLALLLICAGVGTGWDLDAGKGGVIYGSNDAAGGNDCAG
jgi:hypothetical protein